MTRVRQVAGRLRRALHGRDDDRRLAQRRGITLPREDWDEQFASGAWNYLHDIAESAHYSVLVGYVDLLAAGGTVLDVGCGNGVLMDRLGGRNPYTGLDLSPVAIDELRGRAPAGTTLLAVDAADFETDERFDVVVFNESLYLFDRPHVVLDGYRRFLAPGGVILISVFQNKGPAAILDEAVRGRELLADTLVQQGAKRWRCVALRA